jgi:hypothetical protein
VKWRRRHMRLHCEMKKKPCATSRPKTNSFNTKHLNFPYSKAGQIMMSTTTITAAAAAYILTHSCPTIHQILSN